MPDEWRQFNAAFIPVYLPIHPDKSKIAAGTACGLRWALQMAPTVGFYRYQVSFKPIKQ